MKSITLTANGPVQDPHYGQIVTIDITKINEDGSVKSELPWMCKTDNIYLALITFVENWKSNESVVLSR